MKTLMVVIDGLGLREEKQGNAFRQADTPNIDRIMEEHGYQELEASGPAVGLPEGYTGNSEVGHLHLGAGRVIPQRLTRINNAIKKNKLQEKKAVKQVFERAEKKQVPVHLAGIISDGGIHGHINHLKALIEMSKNYSVKLKIHAFADGRDVDPKSAEKYLSEIKQKTQGLNAEIATVMGRFYSMDRDHNWERTRQAYNAMILGEGFQYENPREAVERAYKDDEYDYFIQPSAKNNYEGMKNNHEVIFYNYRADRERQIAEALLEEEFDEFENPIRPNFTSMLPYRRDFENPVIFEKQKVENTLGEKIEEKGLSQLRIAESQKKPHVTYFFNGQRELEFEHETRRFIESDKIRAFDEKPEMHAEEITDIAIQAIEEDEEDFILMNYANCDLVGHTGDINATIKAVEAVDRNLGRLIEKIKASKYNALITADHGNCEDLGTEEKPKTSHTLNKVPLISIGLEIQEIEKISDIVDQIKF